jgi:hypothetical protein
MVTNDERKWKHMHNPDIPQRSGKLKDGEVASFDAQFFGIHGQQAKVCPLLPTHISLALHKRVAGKFPNLQAQHGLPNVHRVGPK